MQLELNEDEVKTILIEWSTVKFPGAFNSVDFKAGYSRLDSATLSLKQLEPEPEPEPARSPVPHSIDDGVPF